MAGLPKIGVEAVVDNSDGYLKAIKAIENANSDAADSVKKTAKSFDVLNDTTDYAKDVQNRYSKSLDDARAGLESTAPAADHMAEAISAAALAVGAAITVFNAIVSVIGAVARVIGEVIQKAVDLGKHIFESGTTFSKTMANISAVTKLTGVDLHNLGKDLIDIGENSIAGPQAVAEAYYDVASGISDASISMGVLKAAIATAEAGQADLTATTNGLISVLNSYKGGMMEATYFSDVFTQTVNVGKGTMDEFVAALSPIASMAAAAKVPFDELGGAMAFMTQKGLTAAQAGTALSGIITQLSRNTPGVNRALRAMGEASIDASIANHGLAGTLKLLVDGAKKTGQNLQTLVGRVEAMKAVTILGTDEFQSYFKTFMDGIDEATSKAREIQRLDVSAQLQLINARFEGIGLSISQAVLPAFGKFLKFINESFKKIDWKKIGAGLDKIGIVLGATADKIIGKLTKLLDGVDWDSIAMGISKALQGVADFLMNTDWEAVITSIITGFQTLATNIGNFFTTVSNVYKFVAGIFDGIGQIITFFVSGTQKLWNDLLKTLNQIGVFKVIQDAATTAGQLVAIAFYEMNQAATTAGMLVTIAGAAIQWVLGQIGIAATAAQQLFAIAMYGINQAATTAGMLVTIAGGVIQWVVGKIGEAAQIGAQVFAGAMDILNQAAGTASMLVGIAGAAINWIVGTIGTIAKNTGDTFALGFKAITDAATGVKNTIGGIIKAIGDAIISGLGPAGQAIKLISDALAGLGGGGSGPGGGSGGGGRGFAKGGTLQEGLNIVGEQGAEALVKHGSRVVVVSHDKTRSFLSGLATKSVPDAGGAAVSKATAMMNSLSGGIVVPRADSKVVVLHLPTPQPSPAPSAPRLPAPPPIPPRPSDMSQMPDAGGGWGHIFKLPGRMPGPPKSMPIPVGGNSTNNSTTYNNRNIDTINFNNVPNGESAVRRFARLQAGGRRS